MENNIQTLKEDIVFCTTCIENLQIEINALRKKNTNDEKILTKMKTRDEYKTMLEEKIKAYDIEKYNTNQEGSDADVMNTKEEFKRKNNSYSIIRNSYPKSVDN